MELLIPSLPEELGLECLTRLPYPVHRVAARVCRRWQDFLLNQEFYYLRKQLGFTRKLACLIQALPARVSTDGGKSGLAPSYGISVFDPVSLTWERVDSLEKYPNGLPLFCQLASCEGKLVVMGGWDPISYGPITDVFVYDLVTRQWRQGKDMPSKRSFFAIGSSEGRVYVAGGHDENKNALKTALVYDLRNDEWTELTQMSRERDECEGMMIGNEFWVVSGYGSDNQGVFEATAESYNPKTGLWTQTDQVWEAGRCPRSSVGLGKDSKLLNWGDLDQSIRVGTCGVMLGDLTLVTGSAYQGAPHGFNLGEMKDKQIGKLQKIDVPDEFSGFVQSGCCVEI